MSQRILILTVHNATNLKKSDLVGDTDAFVEFNFGDSGSIPEELRTATVKNSLNPTWNECHVALIPENTKEFAFAVKDQDVARNDNLGQGTIPVSEPFKSIQQSYSLETGGELNLSHLVVDMNRAAALVPQLQAQIEETSQVLDGLAAELELAKRESELDEEAKKQLQERVDKLQSHRDEQAAVQAANMEKLVQEMKEREEELQKMIGQAEEQQQKLEASVEEKAREEERLRQAKEEWESQLQKINEDEANASSSIASMLENMSSLQETIADGDLNAPKERNTELQNEMTKGITELQSLGVRSDELARNVHELSAQIQAINMENSSLEHCSVQKDATGAHLRQQIEGQNAEIARLQRDLSDAKNQEGIQGIGREAIGAAKNLKFW